MLIKNKYKEKDEKKIENFYFLNRYVLWTGIFLFSYCANIYIMHREL